MESSEKLIVVSPLEPVEVDQEFEHIPPHVTVFPPLELGNVPWRTFNSEMQEIVLENWFSGTTLGGESDVFNNSQGEAVDVTRLNMPGDSFPFLKLFHTHAALYRFCKMTGINFDPTHTGLNYHPHISVNEGHRVQPGERVELSSLAVISTRADRVNKLVKAVYQREEL